MRTFKGNLTQSFKLTISDGFLQTMRAGAQADDASVFLKQTQAAHPKNDDAFIAAVLKNGLRRSARNNLGDLLQNTEGIGGTVSPAVVEVIEGVDEFDAHVGIQTVEVRDVQPA